VNFPGRTLHNLNQGMRFNVVRTNFMGDTMFRRSLIMACFAAVLIVLALPTLATGQAFVQVSNNNPVPTQASQVSVGFANPQTANDLNVVVVGWSDQTSSVTSVTDGSGNTYAMAAGTNAGHGDSQAIFYAANIKAGSNIVTVSFNQAAAFPDVRILEYSGVATTAPLNVSVGNSGSGNTANSGNTTTTVAAAVLVAGGTTAGAFSTTAANFTLDVFPSTGTPLTGADNIAGQQIVSTAGTYNASDSLTVSGGWVMQMAAFGTTSSSFPAPTLAAVGTCPASVICPNTGPDTGGTSVTITGTNFAPGAMALFNNISLVNCSVTNATTMTCTTPSYTEGTKILTVINPDGQSASATDVFTYNLVSPSVSGITPSSDITNGGTAITVSGTNFVGGATVSFDGEPADNVVVVNGTTITANTPAHSAGSANVVVKNPDGGNNGGSPFPFTYTVGTGPINFVQFADSGKTTSNSQSSAVATLSLAENAGDLNVVAIGWSSPTPPTINIIDTEGNTYTQALPATEGTDIGQVIYYAKNIKGGGPNNAVIVNFGLTTPAAYPDVRVAEYSGLDPSSPLDQVASNSGGSTSASTNSLTTTAANEVIVAAGTTQTGFTNFGGGFVGVDLTANLNNLGHQVVTSEGSFDATSLVNPSGNWVMQAVSFVHSAPVPDFSFSPSPSPASNTVTAGSSASYQVSVSALDGFSGTVSLSCSAGLPSGAKCSFNPSSVTPGGLGVSTSTLTISTTVATPGGTSSVTITGKSGSTTHTTSVSLVVQASTTPGFTMAATALSPASVSPGGTATSTITLTGVNGFNVSNVMLACSSITGGGSPAPTCSFGAISGGISTLTVSTTGSSAANKSLRSTGVFYAMLLPIGGMTLLGAGFTSRRKKLLGILLICLVISGFVFMVACGGGSSNNGGGGGGGGGTPAGTYTITVQGTASGATTQTQTLTLTVQ
jgi:hypothetical protein